MDTTNIVHKSLLENGSDDTADFGDSGQSSRWAENEIETGKGINNWAESYLFSFSVLGGPVWHENGLNSRRKTKTDRDKAQLFLNAFMVSISFSAHREERPQTKKFYTKLEKTTGTCIRIRIEVKGRERLFPANKFCTRKNWRRRPAIVPGFEKSAAIFIFSVN